MAVLINDSSNTIQPRFNFGVSPPTVQDFTENQHDNFSPGSDTLPQRKNDLSDPWAKSSRFTQMSNKIKGRL